MERSTHFILRRRHWYYYFKTLNVTTLYWNYDLHSIINKHTPKHQEQTRRSSAKLSTEFSTNRLLGKSRDIISDTHLTTEWSYVTNDQDARNTVEKYVGGNAAHFSLQQGKTLFINSVYMKGEDNVLVIPQLYTRDNKGPIKRLPMIDRKNQYAEGEGTSFSPAVRFHESENCLIVSNDTDAIIYGILAGLQRPRNAQGDFLGQLWVQIVYLQSKTGVMGVRKGKAFEFWNINMLIHNIELKLSLNNSVTNHALKIVALYLAGRSDLTDKWYNKTHETFLVQLMKHTEYIEDLVIFDDTHLPHLNKEFYQGLIHTVWCSKSVCDPSKKSYDELRKETQKRKDKRMHLPQEAITEEIAKRVSGTFTYMLSYVLNVKIPDWSMNGFKFDENKCIYIPKIIPAIVDNENTHADGSLKEDQRLNEIKNTKPEVGGG